MSITISAPLFLILIVGWTWIVFMAARLFGKWDFATDLLVELARQMREKDEEIEEDFADDCK